jgi:hypothetical protein
MAGPSNLRSMKVENAQMMLDSLTVDFLILLPARNIVLTPLVAILDLLPGHEPRRRIRGYRE